MKVTDKHSKKFFDKINRMIIKSTSEKGLTLIETIVVMAIIAIMGTAMSPMVVSVVQKKMLTVTIEELKEFKEAITGKQEIINGEVRTHFGYIGDMGSMPANIEDLYQLGNQTPFAYDSVTRTGAGWNGPYIDSSLVEDLSYLMNDAYSNEYTLSFGTDTSVSAMIVSTGLDGLDDVISGSDDDLSVYIHKSRVFSMVVGVVIGESGNVIPGVTVKMNFPTNGVLGFQETETDSSGRYEFTDIPYGNRSITVEPKLVYGVDSAVISGSRSQDITLFKMTNYSNSQIIIQSLEAEFTVPPPGAYYQTVLIGGNQVFDDNSDRKGDGDTVDFTAITIDGSDAATNGITFPVCVQSPLTQVDDLNVSSGTSKGATMETSLETFREERSGGGTFVDMTGVTFKITLFSDTDGSSGTDNVVSIILFTTM